MSHINARMRFETSIADAAARAVAATRYQPGGRRMCASVESARWATPAVDDSWRIHKQAANEQIMLIPIIETAQAMANLEEICAVSGVDYIYFGRADLCLDMGLDLSEDRTELDGLWAKARDTAHRHGVRIGCHRAAGITGHDYATLVSDTGSA